LFFPGRVIHIYKGSIVHFKKVTGIFSVPSKLTIGTIETMQSQPFRSRFSHYPGQAFFVTLSEARPELVEVSF